MIIEFPQKYNVQQIHIDGFYHVSIPNEHSADLIELLSMLGYRREVMPDND